MKKQKIVRIFFPVIKGTAVRDIIKRKVLHQLAAQLKKKGRHAFFIFLILENKPTFEKEAEGLAYTWAQIPNIPWDNNPQVFFFRRLRNFLFGSMNDISTYNIFIKKVQKEHPVLYVIHKAIQKSCKIKLIRKCFRWLMNGIECFEIAATKKLDLPYQKIFDTHKPDLLYFHSYQDINLVPIARTAKRNSTPFVAAVQSWDNLTTNGDIPVRPDKLLVWSELMKHEAIVFDDYPKKDIIIAGSQQFDYHLIYAEDFLSKDSFFKTMQLDPKKKLITYTTTTPSLFPEEVEFIALLYKQVKSLSVPAQLLVRVYSKYGDAAKKFRKFQGKQDLIIDYAGQNKLLLTDLMPYDDEFLRHLSETMKYSDVIVNVISSTNLDAFIFNTPVVNISFDGKKKKKYLDSVRRYDDYAHVQYVYQSNASDFVYTEEELRNALEQYLGNREKKSKERKKAVQYICGALDAKTNERIAKALFEQIMHHH
ncbi:hypothetical protein C4573_01545 [Candidatus Woesearchaeota archaeon]|nr:MAG: hypothetical protein C4573_01545 [Candidatus Woesearchaeota archaeon]